MKIRKEFLIKGKLWTVEYKWGLRDDDGTPCDGLCRFSTRTIYIKREMPIEDKLIAFFHELIHAILYEAHLNNNAGMEDIVEEVVCDAIATVFTELFQFRWKRRKS